MSRLSIKRKLLVYNILIQFIILVIFSLSLYKTLEISSLDKIKSTLKIVILDVVDDIMEHQGDLTKEMFDEEDEYKFKPLFIRVLKINDKVKIINTTDFPDVFHYSIKKLQALQDDIVYFDKKDIYILSKMKIKINGANYIVQVATDYKLLNSTFENLIYILIFILPIILIFSIIGGYFLIYKSFMPIENILLNLKKINAKDLSTRLKVTNNKNDEIDLLSVEINNLLTRLESSFERISQFSSDASHELKTPLTIIRGEIEIALRKDRDSSEYKETLNTCLEEVVSIQGTINDLLFLAKNEFELQALQEEVYLDEITSESIKELLSLSKIKKINLKVQMDEAMQIKGEAKILKIALKNIIKNSITFSDENSVVIVKNYKQKDQKIIEVQDFGIGIAFDEQQKVFEKFYRTDKSRNKESGGTGLGLSIAKKIIEIHNGAIQIDSVANKGTSVKFIFD